ncbi:MAG TPA: Holliday junction resolvase RuvX [Phycisphaerales bacterium]|nr:Holliday junction resolvase RuvX [Phycisphaerales bacterium]HMP37420.1 Holliday junction resolvase RuvX [Phycisphaerales bacterium]
MRYLALDLGERRTGVAVGDDRTRLVSAVAVLESPRGEALLAALRRTIEEYGPDAIVLGLPINMDEREGGAAASVRAFGETLRTRFGLDVLYQDERLTSFAADQAMARSGRTHGQKRSIRDALAAKEILEDYLRGSADR